MAGRAPGLAGGQILGFRILCSPETTETLGRDRGGESAVIVGSALEALEDEEAGEQAIELMDAPDEIPMPQRDTGQGRGPDIAEARMPRACSNSA